MKPRDSITGCASALAAVLALAGCPKPEAAPQSPVDPAGQAEASPPAERKNESEADYLTAAEVKARLSALQMQYFEFRVEKHGTHAALRLGFNQTLLPAYQTLCSNELAEIEGLESSQGPLEIEGRRGEAYVFGLGEDAELHVFNNNVTGEGSGSICLDDQEYKIRPGDPYCLPLLNPELFGPAPDCQSDEGCYPLASLQRELAVDLQRAQMEVENGSEGACDRLEDVLARIAEDNRRRLSLGDYYYTPAKSIPKE